MARIHPTAIVDPAARLGDAVEIGPFCIVERDVQIGDGTVLRDGAIVRRHTTLGAGNFVDAHTVLGSEPQDLKFDRDSVTHLRIGDRNTFRENCSISRATTPGGATTIGSDNYFMIGAHVGHDSHMGDHCILVNGSCLAGHVELGSRVILSSHVAVHQFCWVGDMCMSQGNCIAVQHVPPFCMFAGVTDIVGLNVIGLRRNPQISEEDRRQVKEAFNILYRSGLPTPKALAQMDACGAWGPAATKFREFVRRCATASKPHNRGIGQLRRGREISPD